MISGIPRSFGMCDCVLGHIPALVPKNRPNQRHGSIVISTAMIGTTVPSAGIWPRTQSHMPKLRGIPEITPHLLADPLTSRDGVPEIDQFFPCHCQYVKTQHLQLKLLLFRGQPASTLDLLTHC